jgi:hypothetical protein
MMFWLTGRFQVSTADSHIGWVNYSNLKQPSVGLVNIRYYGNGKQELCFTKDLILIE